MTYLESKFISPDIFTIIGRFLQYKTINVLSFARNKSFTNDSQIYKEYFLENFPQVAKLCHIKNYKLELTKICKYYDLVDYACANGYLELLKEISLPHFCPRESAIAEAYSNNHREIINYLQQKYSIPSEKYGHLPDKGNCSQIMSIIFLFLFYIICSIVLFIVTILVITKIIPIHTGIIVRGIIIFLLSSAAVCCGLCAFYFPLSIIKQSKNNGYTAL